MAFTIQSAVKIQCSIEHSSHSVLVQELIKKKRYKKIKISYKKIKIVKKELSMYTDTF